MKTESVAVTLPSVGTQETGAAYSEKWFVRLLYAPTMIFLILIAIFPLFYSLGVSLTNLVTGLPAKFIWFQNYADLFTGGDLAIASLTTVRFTIFAVLIEMGLGILIAFALNQRLPGVGVARVIVFLPMMLAPLVVGLFWRFLLDQTFGLVNWSLSALGLQPVAWFVVPSNAIAAIILVDVWQWTPFVILLALAALGTIPEELKEAAALDRAPIWMKFRQIYWPYMKFPLVLAFLFRTIDCLKMFDLAYVLTGGGPGDFTTTISLLTWRYALMFFKIGKAAASSWLLVIAISIIVNILLRVLMPAQKPKSEAVSTGL
jgi:multiple sugar transport system permease protein